MAESNENRYACMFCGQSIDAAGVDPCVALLSARRLDKGDDKPPGQYLFHAQCLRGLTHPSVPLYFLDLRRIHNCRWAFLDDCPDVRACWSDL